MITASANFSRQSKATSAPKMTQVIIYAYKELTQKQ